jgi:hypothetical protein
MDRGEWRSSARDSRNRADIRHYLSTGIDERLLLGGLLDMRVLWIRAPKPRDERPGGLAEAAYLLFA